MNGNGDKKLERDEVLKREQILSVVEEGKKSEYWKVLSKAVAEWKEEEMKYLDSFKKKGMTSNAINEYNRVVDRIMFLDRVLHINEKILSYNNSIVSRLKSVFVRLAQKTPFMSKEEEK